jgi:hypothetical protein
VFVSSQDGPCANVNYLDVGSAGGSNPYGGTPAPIPGRIQAENFDEGGAGVAYVDTTAGNSGGQYRTTDVDIAASVDAGGGYNIGYARPGEWLNYSVNVAVSGTYALGVRYAYKGTSTRLRVEVDGVDKTGPVTLQGTGGWQAWRTYTVPGIALTSGPHTVRLVFVSSQDGPCANVNYLDLSSAAQP